MLAHEIIAIYIILYQLYQVAHNLRVLYVNLLAKIQILRQHMSIIINLNIKA